MLTPSPSDLYSYHLPMGERDAGGREGGSGKWHCGEAGDVAGVQQSGVAIGVGRGMECFIMAPALQFLFLLVSSHISYSAAANIRWSAVFMLTPRSLAARYLLRTRMYYLGIQDQKV